MEEQVEAYIEKYPAEIIDLFKTLRRLIYDSSSSVTEKMWAKLPSYYVGDSFVRLIPFKDHINIEARAVIQYENELSGYKITPKGMLRINAEQTVPNDILTKIFNETLDR